MSSRARLEGVDLNLLLVLDALVSEESVTRAASRVGLSQPAMSHALARLRVLLDDRVLVRAGQRMRASAKAKSMARSVREGLGAFERALWGESAFDLATTERSIRIATADFGQLVVVPPLVAEVARAAPGVDLEVTTLASGIDRALVDGDVDLTLDVGPARRPYTRRARGVLSTRLLEERFVCVLRRRHPDADLRRLTLARYAALPHVIVSPRGRVFGAGDAALAERGLRRHVLLTVPSFLAAANAVLGSDAVLTVAERAARTLPSRSFVVVEPPIALEGFALHLRWHERQDADPFHAWLREAIVRVAARAPTT